MLFWKLFQWLKPKNAKGWGEAVAGAALGAIPGGGWVVAAILANSAYKNFTKSRTEEPRKEEPQRPRVFYMPPAREEDDVAPGKLWSRR